ncbi:UDP-Glycosyltransferase superfamily protein [Euphorbia peplus]|nr:UDP-Glycosyltransferase superfamily protein [Euphorbia peplus]
MAKHPVLNPWLPLQKRCVLALLILLSISTLIAFLIKAAFDDHLSHTHLHRFNASPINPNPNPLTFMKSKLVVLVSHQLSLFRWAIVADGVGLSIKRCRF